MNRPVSLLQLLLCVSGVLLYATALQFKMPNKSIIYDWKGFGFLKNLTLTGKAIGFTGLAIILVALLWM